MIPLVLLEAVAPEDRPDFEKIYRRYRADAVRIAYRVLGDATELEQLMFALPPQYAEVMRLRFLEGYEPKEIGAMLRLSPGAVRMRIERAKEKLRALLIENGYEEYFK